MITFLYPNKDYNEFVPAKKTAEYVPGQAIKHYLQELHLIGTRLRCKMLLVGGYPTPLRMTYVPKDGDTIKMVRVSAMS